MARKLARNSGVEANGVAVSWLEKAAGYRVRRVMNGEVSEFVVEEVAAMPTSAGDSRDLFGMFANRCPQCNWISTHQFEQEGKKGFYCENSFCNVEKVILGSEHNDPEIWTG